MPRELEPLRAFQKFQFQFTRHIRNPQKNPRPAGVPVRRMKVYNELLFNNVEDVLAGCFPVLKWVLGSRKWKNLVRQFFAEHQCKRPFFRQIPDEFMDYLEKERGDRKSDPIFLKALAHYEWIELDLFVADEKIEDSQIDSEGDLLKGWPVFNSVLKFSSYPFEVHRITPDHQPKKATDERFHYLIFRNRKDEVEFMTLNPISARLVKRLLKGKLSGRQALEKIVKELRHPQPEGVIKGGKQILEELQKKGAILGTVRRGNS